MKIVNLISDDGFALVSGFISNEEYAKLINTGWVEVSVVEPVLDESTEPLNTDG